MHLILAGDGETEAELRELAAPLGERAHFIPTPGARGAPTCSRRFDVSVFCPSPTEGAPRAVILGMLASRPCLSTGAEGVADMISPEIGGIASPENDPGARCRAVAATSPIPSGSRARAPGPRRAAERYAAPVVAEQIERLLDQATARVGTPAP